MKVVVDTNILVSSFLSPYGPPSKVVRLIMSGHLRVCYDMRIFSEYAGVLERPKFHISPILSANLLEQIRAAGELICARTLPLRLSDPSDAAFLEVALAAQSGCLITGNIRHFPSSCRRGMRVFSPAEFLAFYGDPLDHAGGTVKSSSEEYRSSKRFKNKKNKMSSTQGVCSMSFAEFAKKMDSIRDIGDRAWTPEEVAKVIQSIRRDKSAPKELKIRKNTSRKAAMRHLERLSK